MRSQNGRNAVSVTLAASGGDCPFPCILAMAAAAPRCSPAKDMPAAAKTPVFFSVRAVSPGTTGVSPCPVRSSSVPRRWHLHVHMHRYLRTACVAFFREGGMRRHAHGRCVAEVLARRLSTDGNPRGPGADSRLLRERFVMNTFGRRSRGNRLIKGAGLP